MNKAELIRHEIEKRRVHNLAIGNPLFSAMAEEDIELLCFIDTLEVKEVDLEDSVKETLAQKYINYTFKRYNIDPESKEGQLIYYAYMHGINQCLNQLKAQK